MKDKEFYDKTWEGFALLRNYCYIVIITILAIIFLASCGTKSKIEYVDREVVRYETKVQHDTLINNIHDSVRIEKKGDTVFVDRWHTKIHERINVRTDTCYRDSVRTVIKESVKEKEVIPNWCYLCLALGVIVIIFTVRKVIKWIQIH